MITKSKTMIEMKKAIVIIAVLMASSCQDRLEAVKVSAGAGINKEGRYGGWVVYQNEETDRAWNALAFVDVKGSDGGYSISQGGEDFATDSDGFAQFTIYSPMRQDSVWVETDINDSVSVRSKEPAPGSELIFTRRTITTQLLDSGLRYAELSEVFSADSVLRYRVIGSGVLKRAGE